MTSIDFYFDPACPWTWLTYRWLVDAARTRDASVTCRPLSLAWLNRDNDPGPYAEVMRSSMRTHRLFVALHQARRDDLVGTVYTAIGTRVHDGGEQLTRELVEQAATGCGATDWLHALDDESLDSDVAASTDEALKLAGGGVGSPVLAFGEPRTGFHGPIVNPGPRGERGARLLDLILEVGAVDGFFELKRGRETGPELPAPA